MGPIWNWTFEFFRELRRLAKSWPPPCLSTGSWPQLREVAVLPKVPLTVTQPDLAWIEDVWVVFTCLWNLVRASSCFIMSRHFSSASATLYQHPAHSRSSPRELVAPKMERARRSEVFHKPWIFRIRTTRLFRQQRCGLVWVCIEFAIVCMVPFFSLFSNFLVSQKSIEIWWYLMLARLRCIIHTIPCIAISYHIDTWKCRQIALKNPAGPMACLHRRTLAACPALGIEGNRMNDGWIMLAWFENVRYLRAGAQTMVGCTVSTTFTF